MLFELVSLMNAQIVEKKVAHYQEIEKEVQALESALLGDITGLGMVVEVTDYKKR